MAQKKSCIPNLNPDFTEPRTFNNPLKQTENESRCFVLFCLDSFSFLGIARSHTVRQRRGSLEYPEWQPVGLLSGISDQS